MATRCNNVRGTVDLSGSAVSTCDHNPFTIDMRVTGRSLQFASCGECGWGRWTVDGSLTGAEELLALLRRSR